MKHAHRMPRCCGFLLAVAVSCGTSSALAATSGQAILDASGVRGGLVVHLGCGDGSLTATLHTGDRYLVQGLDAGAANIAAARTHIRSLGLYGKVSVRQWSESERLPYVDNLVNLLVIGGGRPAAGGIANVVGPRGPAVDVERVLAPQGVALVHGQLITRGTKLVASPSGLLGWTKYVKPRPGDIDDWTHYLHDAGNNAVADDDRVGPPHYLQWKAGPAWCRSHEFASSVQALVSADGRLVGVIDEGIIGQPRGVPPFWTLIARDAFNGILLWRRPCSHINAHALTAVGDKVYVTLTTWGPLSILDAATGETLHTCDQTGKVGEIAFCDNRLILSTRLADAQGGSGPHVAAADPGDGHLLWAKAAKAIAGNTLVVGSGRVCYYDDSQLVCLSLDNGEELWRTDVKTSGKGYAVLYGGAVLLTGGSTRAFSLESGELLWTGPDGNPHARNPPGLFGADGLIWCAWDYIDPRSFLWQAREEKREGFDPMTGEVKRTVTAERLVTAGHHIRCYPPKATSRYLLLNKRGVEFFDLQGTNHMRANWTRGACGFGMLPANGLLYTPPSQCFCYQGVLLTGMNALASTRQSPQGGRAPSDGKPRLERGPAYGTAVSSTLSSSSDWPTYRHDVYRSGSIETSLPAKLDRVWVTSLSRPALDRADNPAAGKPEEPAFVLKAADATLHGRGAKKSGDAIVAWRGKDTSASWQTEIDASGKQPVWICQSNQGPGGSVFELAIGAEKLTGKIRHTDSWDEYVWIRVGDVEMPQPGSFSVSVTPIQQVDGRLGNVAAVAIGGQTPPAQPTESPKLREYPQGLLTPPVAAEGKVFVAEPDAHMVHAVRAADGKRLWTFVADGRVDSPPSIFEGLCIFGSTDGCVYCLSASDGQLVWRFRAAPEERQVCVRNQLESAWPVHGSVLVRDGKVYCTAGRSSFLDGGMHVYALDARSGRVVHETLLASDDPDVSKDGGRPFDMDGAKSDILVAGPEDIYLYQNRFNADLTLQPTPRITKLGDRRCEAHLMTTTGLLDTSWFNRTYWIYADRWPGYYFTYRGPKSGQILVFDKNATYALKAYTERHGHSPEFLPGSGYQLIADRNTTEPVLDEMEIGAEKGRGFSRTELPIWCESIPIRVQAMLLAGEHLYLAGPPDLVAEEDAYEAMIGKRGAVFRVVSTSDGSTLAEFEMKEAPVFDGLIAAGGRIYMTTLDGTLICWE